MNCTCCNQTGTNACGCPNAANFCSCADQGVDASFTSCACCRCCCAEDSTGGEGGATGGRAGTSCCRRRCCSCGC